jgi:hypothetical protein
MRKKLFSNQRARAYFESRPPSHRHLAVYWIASAKRERGNAREAPRVADRVLRRGADRFRLSSRGPARAEVTTTVRSGDPSITAPETSANRVRGDARRPALRAAACPATDRQRRSSISRSFSTVFQLRVVTAPRRESSQAPPPDCCVPGRSRGMRRRANRRSALTRVLLVCRRAGGAGPCGRWRDGNVQIRMTLHHRPCDARTAMSSGGDEPVSVTPLCGRRHMGYPVEVCASPICQQIRFVRWKPCAPGWRQSRA